jgi:hypothetical protein
VYQKGQVQDRSNNRLSFSAHVEVIPECFGTVGALFCYTPSKYPPRGTQPYYALHEGISWSTMLNSPSIQAHLHQSTMSNLHRTTRLSLLVLEIIKHIGNYNPFHYEFRNGVSKQFYYEGCCHSSSSLPTLITADCLDHFRF